MIIGLVEEAMNGCAGRRPIRPRTPSDWIAFAARLDCVRRPLGLRSSNNDFS